MMLVNASAVVIAVKAQAGPMRKIVSRGLSPVAFKCPAKWTPSATPNTSSKIGITLLSTVIGCPSQTDNASTLAALRSAGITASKTILKSRSNTSAAKPTSKLPQRFKRIKSDLERLA
jgi:hypothetical protein